MTLQQLSPLVMFELKHGDAVNHDLLQAFNSLGYEIFRLIPGLNALAPATISGGFDSFQLNLFACKPARAAELEKRGLLISQAMPLPCTVPLQPQQFPALATSTSLRLAPLSQDDVMYFAMLASFLASQDQNLPLQQRYQHLLFAFETLQPQLDAKEERIERLASMARVAFEFGARNLGSTILDSITKQHFQSANTINVQDVFVQASAPMESLSAVGNPVQWLCAGVLDGLIRKHAYSCYFTGPKMIPLMQKLEQGAYLHPDIARRIVAMRDLIDAIQQSPPDE